MRERHPFLVRLDELRSDAYLDGVGLKAFDEFVHVPGVAEQLARLVESGTDYEAESAAGFLRFLRPCPARTVILRRIAALPPTRRVRLSGMLMSSERDAFLDVLGDAYEHLEARERRLQLIVGEKTWLERQARRPLAQLTEEAVARIESLRRQAGVGVVTVFWHALQLRLRKPVRAELHALLGHQPGEPAARALQADLLKATGVEETRRLRREVMRQGSLTPPPPEGTFRLEVWEPSAYTLSFRLVESRPGEEDVILDGSLPTDGRVRSLRAADPQHQRESHYEVPILPADPALFHGLLLRNTRAVPHETEVLLERMLGVEPKPFVLPKPAGRLAAAELESFTLRGLLGSPPEMLRPTREAGRAPWRTPQFRRYLVAWLQAGATLAVLAGHRDEAAALVAEAAFVSSGRRSDVYDFAANAAWARRPLPSPQLTAVPS